MTNIFESPWLLLTAAGFSVLLSASLWQAGVRGGRGWFILPTLLAALALALDAAVATDNEKIDALVKQCRRAVRMEDATLLAEVISPAYHDRVHPDKEAFLRAAQAALTGAGVEKIRFQRIQKELSPPDGRLTIDAVVHLKETSRYHMLGSVVFVSGTVRLKKNHAGLWLIHKAGVNSVNNQPLRWGESD